MNRSTGIPLALVVFGTALVNALSKTILENQELLNLLALIAGMALVAMAFTWGYIEWWKRGQFSPEVLQRTSKPYRGKGIDPDARERNLIYNRAVLIGFRANLSTGVVFLMIVGATARDWIVLVVAWLIWSAVVGFAVPWAWRVVSYYMRPGRRREAQE